jgi:rubrerythrin
MSAVFTDAQRGVQAVNASMGERELVATLERHGADEGEILARYNTLAEALRSPAARYLVSYIMDDERRHHRIIEELANTVAWGGFNAAGEVAKVPDLRNHRYEAADFIAETQRLLDFEKKDRRELRRLRKDLHDFEDTTVWALLVDTMILDTDKHIRILKFLLDHLSAEPTGTAGAES